MHLSNVGSTSRRALALAIFVAACVCYVFVTLVDRWAIKPETPKVPRHISQQFILDKDVSKHSLIPTVNWEKVYSERVEHVRDICEHDEMAMMRRVWRVAANRRFGKKAYCKTRMCPIIVDEKKVLFFCFIPKVASTRIKEFFLDISGVKLNQTLRSNDTALHLVANDFLQRVSPMYYPASTARRFYKIIFVRHPFDRLVSAYRDKAEVSRDEAEYFYDKFWDPVMKKLRPNSTIDENSRISFREFVWYLTHSLERDFDDHWTPYWNRCDPCLVDYDFIGKFETAARDFEYSFKKVGIESPPNFWSSVKPTERSVTLKYFAQIPDKEIRELYRVYKLDFDLYNYTLHDFLKIKT